MMNKFKNFLRRITSLYSLRFIFKTVRSIHEYSEILINYIISIKKKENAYIQYYKFPEHFPDYFRRAQPFFDLFIYKLKNVTVDIRNGLVYTNSRQFIFQESYGSLRKMFIWNCIKPPAKATAEQKGELIFLPLKGFFHFLLEELPAVLHAKESNDQAKIVFSGINSTEYYESVKSLFKDEEVLVQKKIFTCDSLIFTKHPEYSGFVSKYDLAVLNKFFNPFFNNNKYEKIYISRRLASKRKIANEIEVEKLCDRYGYQIVYLEELNFIEQIEIVSAAKKVIGPHGAGLSHLCWNNKPKEVLEIFPSYQFNDCFARLAVMQGYDYNYIKCIINNENEVVPMDELEDIIHQKKG